MATEKSEKKASKQQMVELDPSTELVFRGPFTDVVTTSLKLKNPTKNTILFKVKTTVPKQYCVRPNSGVLNGGEEAVVSVMLQHTPALAPLEERSKHKFMVQTMLAPPDFAPDQLETVLKAASGNKDAFVDSKLKCVFEDTAPSQPNPVPSILDTDTTPATLTEENSANTLSSVTSSSEQVPVNKNVDTEPQQTKNTTSLTSQVLAGATPAKAAPTQVDPEKEKAQLESTIRQLQNTVDKLSKENEQLKGEATKLRQRTPFGGAAAPTQQAIKPPIQRPQQSSPLSIIAILLILVALILGYIVGRWL